MQLAFNQTPFILLKKRIICEVKIPSIVSNKHLERCMVQSIWLICSIRNILQNTSRKQSQ